MKNKIILPCLLFILVLCLISNVNAENETIVENNNARYLNLNNSYDEVSNCNEILNLQSEVNLNFQLNEVNSQLLPVVLNPLNFNVKSMSTFDVSLYKLTINSNNYTQQSLANKVVHFYIRNMDYTRITDSAGIAHFNINLGRGVYTITCYFDGDEVYNSAINTFEINVFTGNCYLNYYTYSVDKGGSFDVIAFDENNNRLANKVVNFNINGGSYTRTTDSNGHASMAINLNMGTYLMKCWINDGTYNCSIHNVTLYVNNLKSVIIAPININVKMYDKFYVKFFDDTFNPLVEQKVTFIIRGIEYNRTTDSNGKAGMNINLANGQQNILIKYVPNYNLNAQGYPTYQYEELSAVIDVISTSTSNTYSFTSSNTVVNQHSYFEFVLKNSNGNVLSGKRVTICIDRYNYYRTTDINGHASFIINLNRGLCVISLSYIDNEGIGIFDRLIYVNDNFEMNVAQSNVNPSNYINLYEDYNCIDDNNLIATTNSIISNCSSDLEKIIAIHNYVYKSGYRLYYNGLFNAAETFSLHRGNCYDQSNLEMSMAKIANLPVRAVLGSSHVSNVDHVWVQCYIDGLWIVSDPTNTKLFGSWGNIPNYDTFPDDRLYARALGKYGIYFN